MDKKTKIANLLAQGLTPANVAAYTGVTPAYISQLVKDPAFKELILTQMNTDVAAKTDEELLSTKYTSMEHRLLAAMEESLAGAELRDITGALRVVAERQEAKAKRLSPVNTPGNVTNITAVSVYLPRQVIPTLTLNSKNEVIAVDEKPMAPMSAKGVTELFTKMQNAKLPQEIAHEKAPAQLTISPAADF